MKYSRVLLLLLATEAIDCAAQVLDVSTRLMHLIAFHEKQSLISVAIVFPTSTAFYTITGVPEIRSSQAKNNETRKGQTTE